MIFKGRQKAVPKEFRQYYNIHQDSTKTQEFYNLIQLLGGSQQDLTTFKSQVKDAIANKKQIVFANFIIDWEKNVSFKSKKAPIIKPHITKVESSNVASVYIKNSLINTVLDRELMYNKTEIYPGLILYKDQNNLKIAFNDIIVD